MFFLDVHLLNLAKTASELGFQTFSWNFWVYLVVILTHLEICTGSLDNRFKKPLALSFQNTPWKMDLKMNFLRNFHFKKKLFCILGYLALWICYLKSLCIFPNELKLQPKIPQISRKYLEAKFRGRFRQVQQVNVKAKIFGQFPEVFIKLYTKFWAISTIKWQRKKICRKTKKTPIW